MVSWGSVSELDLEHQHRFRPPAGAGPLRDGVLDREVEQLDRRLFAREAALGLDRFAQLAVARLDPVVGVNPSPRQ